MNNFEFFMIWDCIILIGVILIALIILYYNLKNIKSNFIKGNIKNIKTRNILEIFIGFVFIILSIKIYFYIERSHTGIFKAVSMLTSRPFVILSIIVFLTGVILMISGLYKLKLYDKSNKKLRTS
jgi:DMSO/TMAO reductase YedYZ heme-binding membrane subunit